MVTTRSEMSGMVTDANSVQSLAFDAIARLIEESETIAICAHTSPDGDALGSGLGLAEIIRAKWPGKQVTNLLADTEPVPRIYRFLPKSDTLVPASGYEGTPDLFIAVDLSSISRLNEAQPVCERARRVAIMDHHPCERPFAETYVIRPGAAAVGVIMAEFAQHLGVPITPALAQDLFCAIITDTGRFQYQNTDGEAFQVASLLVDAGASPSEVSLHVYQSFRLQYMHLKSLVTGRIITFDHGRIAYSYATLSDLKRTGASLDECDGLIDTVRSVDGTEVALFLKEVDRGVVRGNLRSKGSCDISRVAARMGGGGHPAAAGFTCEGVIDEVLEKVLPLLLEALHDECPQEGVAQ